MTGRRALFRLAAAIGAALCFATGVTLGAALAATAAHAQPYPQAVADRFPPPPVRYETPAFGGGHEGFTSNDELEAFVSALAARSGAALLDLGRSAGGRRLLALQFGQDPKLPVALLLGQQHGDEPAGGEAMLALAQQLADPASPLAPVLQRLRVVIVPRVNPDGAALGRRGNAAGADINRDHLLLATPEARAIAGLMRSLRPILVVDAHERRAIGGLRRELGVVEHDDLALQYGTTPNQDEALAVVSETWFRQPLLSALAAAQVSAGWYRTWQRGGGARLAMGGIGPGLARNAGALVHAVGFVLETRGLGLGRAHFARRVYTHVLAASTLLGLAADRADALLALQRSADQAVAAAACTGAVVVTARTTSTTRRVTMIDAVTGADREVEVAWESTLDLRPTVTRARPCGYWLAADQEPAALRLRALGLTVRRLAAPHRLPAERYVEVARGTAARAGEHAAFAPSDTVLQAVVDTVPTLLHAPVDSYLVPLAQPLAALAVAALEPDSIHGYFAHHLISRLDGVARLIAPLPGGPGP